MIHYWMKNMSINISDKAKKLIIDFESGGEKFYKNIYKSRPIWPEGASGITLFLGLDLGYYSKNEVIEMLDEYYTDEEMEIILSAVGLKGQRAKEFLPKIKNKITCPWEIGLKLFDKYTLPKFTNLTVKTFPGSDQLCEDAFGALVSIVFNRGSDLRGSRRIEMLNIRNLVTKKDYKGIATEIRKMKRLWKNNPNSNSDLTDRREAEAKLVESCI